VWPIVEQQVIWTVGHSRHPLETFAQLLLCHRVQVVADVRSYPYSRVAPQFGREHLQSLDIQYLFLGEQLGGRPSNEEHYDEEGHALYEPMSQEPGFCEAIEQLIAGSEEHRIALLCSEADPEFCHRRLLVGKVLTERGMKLRHILGDGSVRTERTVSLPPYTPQQSIFGAQEQRWRSTQSVLRKRAPSTFSID
jgi:uncharacterized protein (DUF488 family)